MKILLVEDDSFLSDLYKNSLEKSGHNIFQSFEPEEALKTVLTAHPDLVILDLIMPHFSGLEVLKKIKADPKTALIPVIVLSNIRDEKIKKEALELGAKGYIVKTSTTPAQIPEEIKKYL